MPRRNTTHTVLLVLPLIALASASAQTVKPTLTIRLYDYAGVSERTVSDTIKVAAKVFEQAGIGLAWEQCTTPVSPARDVSCKRRADALIIQMRLHGKQDGKALQLSDHDFGYAFNTDRGLGVVAGAYLDRASLLARERGPELSVVLGHILAHEIGHLLLGAHSHAKSGVMTAVWGERQLRLAETATLLFNKSQAKRMQKQVSARIGIRTKAASTAALAETSQGSRSTIRSVD